VKSLRVTRQGDVVRCSDNDGPRDLRRIEHLALVQASPEHLERRRYRVGELFGPRRRPDSFRVLHE
jgi:hypothetical protein